MDGDMLARLQHLQAKVTQFGELANQLAQAVPQRAQGSDASGWVHVVLGAGGLPAAIRVRDGWDRRIEAAGLGAAVMDANTDAIRQGMNAFSDHLDNSRWWAHRARLDEDGPDPSAGDVARPPAGRERDPAELNEDILKALHKVQQPPPAPPVRRECSDPLRHVTVTLGPSGLTGCSIDPDWAARCDGNAITATLAQALRAAQPAAPGPAIPGVDVDDLLGDALATLQAITDQRPAGGDKS